MRRPSSGGRVDGGTPGRGPGSTIPGPSTRLLPTRALRLRAGSALSILLLVGLVLVGCGSTTTAVVTTGAALHTATEEALTTPPAPPAATATPTASPQATRTPRPSATVTPSPTPKPSELIAFESYRDGNSEIYLLDTESGELLNLTRHPADDRAPAWSPDGRALAFESRRDGNWEIYVLDLDTASVFRLTDDPGYDGAPTWSPDGTTIAFESYRGGDLDIYVVPAAGGEPQPLAYGPAGGFGPAWSPDGRIVAFTSWRDGNKEVYVVPAAGGEPRNLTQNPADDEDPAWSPDGTWLAFTSWRDVDPETGNRDANLYALDVQSGTVERLTGSPWPDLDPSWDGAGRLVWVAYDPGSPFETYDPHRPGDLHVYRQADGGPERLTDSDWDDRRPAPAPAQAGAFQHLAALLPPESAVPTPAPTADADSLVPIVQVPGVLASFSQEPVRVSALVSPSLAAWREDLLAASGWDFLHMTLGAWRNIDTVRKKAMYAYDYGYLSWHKAGRALDLALEYKVEGTNQMVLVREDLGENVYWRMFLRTAKQDGSQGEPLKDNPWLHWWHIVPEQDPEAYDAGGKRLSIPGGYYVDVTALAKRHGWERIACYAIEGDYHWNTDSNGTEYWHYERTDGLLWWEAMGQIYPLDTLEQHVGWEVALQHAQTEEMVRSKGIPPPAP